MKLEFIPGVWLVYTLYIYWKHYRDKEPLSRAKWILLLISIIIMVVGPILLSSFALSNGVESAIYIAMIIMMLMVSSIL